MRLFYLCGAACIASLLPSGVNADLIFDQRVDLTSGDGFISDFSAGSGGGGQQMADDFQLAPHASIITDVHWWGLFS